MKPLDRTDFQIVRLLRNNARLSNKELAAKVGLAPSTCLVRTRLLQQEGVITGFRAEVDAAKLGVGLQAMIAVRLKRHYKPYSLTLHDFTHERYPGTQIPKNFSSLVTLDDPERPVNTLGEAALAAFDGVLDRLEAVESVERTGYGETVLGPVHRGRARRVLRVAGQLARRGVTASRSSVQRILRRPRAPRPEDRIPPSRYAGLSSA